MSRKSRKKAEAAPTADAPTVAESFRRRRNRRMIFVGLIALSFPILEVIAYQFRAITMTFDNRTEGAITGLKATFPGGSIEVPEIKPGGVVTRVTRPDFSFSTEQFATYPLTIRFSTAGGTVISQVGRAGAIDFSAHEKYVIEEVPTELQVQLRHTTSPGFPLGTIRDLLAALGLG